MSNINLKKYVFGLQKSGKGTFTRYKALSECNMSRSGFQSALTSLLKKGLLISPKKEFYVIVPTEYINRPLLPTYYIDDLMNHLNKPYYVGCLSAATFHGAIHQQPMEFQVITQGPLRKIELNGIRILFLSKKNIQDIPTIKTKTKTGYMNISTRETTVFDVVRYLEHSGYLDNVTNVIMELASSLRAKKLGFISKHYETTVLQRTGYLLDEFGGKDLLSKFIYEELKKRKSQFIALSTYSRNKKVTINNKWKLKINETVEPDL